MVSLLDLFLHFVFVAVVPLVLSVPLLVVVIEDHRTSTKLLKSYQARARMGAASAVAKVAQSNNTVRLIPSASDRIQNQSFLSGLRGRFWLVPDTTCSTPKLFFTNGAWIAGGMGAQSRGGGNSGISAGDGAGAASGEFYLHVGIRNLME